MWCWIVPLSTVFIWPEPHFSWTLILPCFWGWSLDQSLPSFFYDPKYKKGFQIFQEYLSRSGLTFWRQGPISTCLLGHKNPAITKFLITTEVVTARVARRIYDLYSFLGWHRKDLHWRKKQSNKNNSSINLLINLTIIKTQNLAYRKGSTSNKRRKNAELGSSVVLMDSRLYFYDRVYQKSYHIGLVGSDRLVHLKKKDPWA